MSGLMGWTPYDAGLLVDTGQERCGFVVKYPEETADGRYGFLETRNISPEPSKFFEMDPDVVRNAFAEFNVIGIWHSHPPGCPQPSLTDREWHPGSLDLYIVCDLAIKRFVALRNSIDYQEVPVPWTVSSAAV